MFNLKTTSIYQANKLERNPFFRFRKLFKILFFSLAIISLLFASLGAAILFLSLALLFFEFSLFFNSKIKNPSLKYSISEALLRPEDFNFASFLDFETAKICQKTLKKAKKRNFREPAKELLLFHLLNPKIKEVNFIFGRAGLSFKGIRQDLEKELLKIDKEWTPHFDKMILRAANIARNRQKSKIGLLDVLISFADSDPFFQKFLNLNNLRKEDIENLADWYQRIEERVSESKKFWRYENLLKKGSIAKDWSAGYSITLDKYSFDLKRRLRKSGFREIVGHQKEIKRVERILEKKGINNILLVGEPGTGRKSIVEALAQRAFLGKSSQSINYKRIINFDLVQLVAEVPSLEKLEIILDECFSQVVQAGNIILVIEEIQNFFSDIPKPGTVDISGILARYLPLSSFQLIAITTYRGLHTIIEKRPSLLSLFEKVEVSEISEKETLRFLENFVPFFEKRYKKFINYKALREILRLSSKYLQDNPFPQKALQLLDESMSWLAIEGKESVLKPEHIKRVVSEKTEIPLETFGVKEKQLLLNLEELIHQRIINQEEAVREVSASLRRARAEIQTRSGPMGSFLFLGPTGVGKTETSKALSAVYFGSEKRMIRLDMSEFQEISDIKRLVGEEGKEGLLTTPVRENPFSLVLLDEIEKAHSKILNLFLQVLDEGWVTDGFGRKIDFKNTVIIATSNAGAEIIREDIKRNKKLDIIKEDLLDYIFKKAIFRPEFINRFDAVVVFKPLTKENLLAISQLMFKKLSDNLRDKGIDFEITNELKEKIVELSYSPQFGAREMRRVIQNKVENLLAQGLLSAKIKRGDKVKIKVEREEEFRLIVE